MNHEARQVRQAARNAVLLAGLSANRPAHPLLGGGVDRFHQGLAKVIIAMVEQLSSGHDNGLSTVALSGGVFQNRILLELVKSDLTKKSYRVLTHKQVPTNDGGISLGQAVISAAGQIEKKERSHVSWHTWASR